MQESTRSDTWCCTLQKELHGTSHTWTSRPVRLLRVRVVFWGADAAPHTVQTHNTWVTLSASSRTFRWCQPGNSGTFTPALHAVSAQQTCKNPAFRQCIGYIPAYLFLTQRRDSRYCSALEMRKNQSQFQILNYTCEKRLQNSAFLVLFVKYQNPTEKLEGAKFSVHFSGFFGWAFICSGDTQLTRVHHISAAFRFFNTKSMAKQQQQQRKKVLSYEKRSISSVLLIKSYFNIKYSYSILYTSFSLLAEYCYWLFKQKNFNHFALQRFEGTIRFPAATLITVVGGQERGKDGGINVPKLYIRLRSRLKEGKFFRM